MSNKEALETLSKLEEFFFYKMQNPEELGPFWSILADYHSKTKEMLIGWHNITGEVID